MTATEIILLTVTMASTAVTAGMAALMKRQRELINELLQLLQQSHEALETNVTLALDPDSIRILRIAPDSHRDAAAD